MARLRALPRRRVIGSANLKTGKNVGRQKVWAYVIEDIAELLGMSVEATRKAIQRGRFDPGDLRSIFEYSQRRVSESEVVAEIETKETGQLPASPKLLPR